MVVYAAGARHRRPELPGVETTVEACDVLTGAAAVGQRVVVAGGGMIGSETASYLATTGRRVTIVEQREAIALEEGGARRADLLAEFARREVRLVVGATISGFADGAVRVVEDGTERSIDCDTVLALGMTPDVESLDAIRAVADVRVVGDAAEAADGLRASRDGFACGLSIGRAPLERRPTGSQLEPAHAGSTRPSRFQTRGVVDRIR